MKNRTQFFAPAIRLICKDLIATLRIVLVPSVVAYLALLSLSLVDLYYPDSFSAEDDLGFTWRDALNFSQILATIAVVVAAYTAIAVAWHRYVLLDERPKSWWPSLTFRQFRKYIRHAFPVTCILGFVMLVSLLFSHALEGPVFLDGDNGPIAQSWGSFIYVTCAFALIYVVAFRISLALPAAALGRSGTIRHSWRAMRGTLFVTLGAAVLIAFVEQLFALTETVFRHTSAIGFLIFISSEVVNLFFLSLLTLFYIEFGETSDSANADA